MTAEKHHYDGSDVIFIMQRPRLCPTKHKRSVWLIILKMVTCCQYSEIGRTWQLHYVIDNHDEDV